MKKSIPVLLCLIAAFMPHATKAQADKGQSEISVAYGSGSVYYLIADGETAAAENSSGVSLISYKYYVTERMTIGLGIGVENISGYGVNGNGKFITVAPEMTFAYMDKKYKHHDGSIRLYGGVARGILEQMPEGSAQSVTNGPWWPFGIQLTGLGLRFGSTVGGFFEIGTGYKGLINFGMSVRFPKKNKVY